MPRSLQLSKLWFWCAWDLEYPCWFSASNMGCESLNYWHLRSTKWPLQLGVTQKELKSSNPTVKHDAHLHDLSKHGIHTFCLGGRSYDTVPSIKQYQQIQHQIYQICYQKMNKSSVSRSPSMAVTWWQSIWAKIQRIWLMKKDQVWSRLAIDAYNDVAGVVCEAVNHLSRLSERPPCWRSQRLCCRTTRHLAA